MINKLVVMKNRPPTPANETIDDPVQDYLDMLLGQATEHPDAQVEAVPVRQSAPLAVVNAPVALKQSMRRRTDHVNTRPYAEPVKPLTFKMQELRVESVSESKSAVIESKITTPLVKKQQTFVSEPTIVAPKATTVDEEKTVEPAADSIANYKAEAWVDGRPSWAQERFECLLFAIGGLTLAVPLVELGSIYPMNEKLTPLFGQIDWFMGLLPIKDANIRTVNTAKIVMPERYQDGMEDNFSYVISINNVDWGLAVDSVASAITLEPEDVRWRAGRSKRPWLAGTVIEHMCALVDVSQLTLMLIEQDRNSQH